MPLYPADTYNYYQTIGGGETGVASRQFTFFVNSKHQNISRWMSSISNIPGNIRGHSIEIQGLIHTIRVKTSSICVARFHIYKNLASVSPKKPTLPPDVTIELNNEDYKYIQLTNKVFNQGDTYKVFMELITGKVSYPTLTLEVKGG